MTRRMGPRDESWLIGRGWESGGSAQAAAPFALPGDRPHYLQDRNVDVDHIKLTVSFDLNKKQVIGKAELRLRPIVDGVQRIELDCEDTRVSSVSVGMTQAGFVLDGKKLRIELPWRYSRGRTFLLAIEYVSTPQQASTSLAPTKDTRTSRSRSGPRARTRTTITGSRASMNPRAVSPAKSWQPCLPVGR